MTEAELEVESDEALGRVIYLEDRRLELAERAAHERATAHADQVLEAAKALA